MLRMQTCQLWIRPDRDTYARRRVLTRWRALARWRALGRAAIDGEGEGVGGENFLESFLKLCILGHRILHKTTI